MCVSRPVLQRLTAALLAVGLSACGGGGGNDNGVRIGNTPLPNQAPAAVISASTVDGFAALTVDFDGTASRDLDGQITDYRWDFGDGSPTVSGSSPSHTFTDPGGYNVRLTVTDNDGSTGEVLQNVRVRGARLSGTVQILTTSAVDSDVNDRLTSPVSNDDFFSAQAIPNPVRLGGWVNLPGTGTRDGNFFTNGDPADFYAVTLTGNELILLKIGDATADLDLYLWDETGSTILDSSLGRDATESIPAPGPGSYFIEVVPFAGVSNLSGGSNYVLSIGQDLGVTARRPTRLSDAFVPDEVLIAGHSNRLLPAMASRYAATERGRAGRFSRSQIGPETLERIRARQTGPRLMGSASPRMQSLAAEHRAKYRTLLALKALSQDPEVAHAEVNAMLVAHRTPDDELYPLQWHYPEIKLPAAWDITTGEPSGGQDVIVAVVDTGILPNHPDFDDQLVSGYDFIADAGRARDFNGIDNDPTDQGDFAYGGSSSFHGSHVAGTVAARSDNTEGVAGVAWGAKIMPMRALGVDGGTAYDVMQAVRYAAGLDNDSGRLPSRRADIINLSLGSPFFSQAAQDTITEARNQGVIIIASAGNESSTAPNYPAAYNGVVSVSASTIDGTLAPYSNTGSSIDFAAPGGFNGTDRNGDGFPDGVISILGDDSVSGPVQLGYGSLNGTSMAAPHVAGVAALMKAVHPGLTPAQFDAALEAGNLTDDFGTAGYDPSFGWGLINAQKAVLTALDLANGPGGIPLPVLGVSLSSVNFGVLATTQVVRLSNLGSGTIVINEINASEPWLQALPAAVDGNGLGDYQLRIDRTGLSEGAYNASIEFVPLDPATNPATITVTLQVPGVNPSADAGLFFVIAVNEDGSSEGNAAVVAARNGAYEWVLNDIPAGSYRIFAGSDMDNDNFLCDAGESCGAFRTLDIQERISVDPQTTPTIEDLDFVSEFRAVLTTQALADGAAPDKRVDGASHDDNAGGIPFRKPAPPTRRSAAEER
ncbi:MAG: S8 family serine peptidase [Pseudomonadota bacterium]